MSTLPPWDGQPLSVEEAFHSVTDFAATYGPGSALLAAHAAVLERIRPEILALVRRNFLSGSDRHNVSLDADVLFGPLSCNLGGGYYKVDREVRRQLLVSLDAWGGRRGEEEYRSRRVARFVRQYVGWVRRSRSHNNEPVFDEYLNLIDWVALAYDNPDAAARALFREMNSRLNEPSKSRYKIRFGGITSVLDVPMAAFMDELNYARAIDALYDDDYQRALALVGPLRNRSFSAGDVELPPPHEMLERYEIDRDLQQLMPCDEVDAYSNQAGSSNETTAKAPQIDGLLPDLQLTIETRDPADDSPLHTAVKARDSIAVKQFLYSDPILVDRIGLEGKTALHMAAERGEAYITELLINAGAAIDLRDSNLTTPLYLAAENGRYDTASILLEKGADVESRNRKGSTPLLACAFYGHAEVLQLLIEKKASVDARNNFGFTPIGAAAQSGRLSIVDLLLSKGARFDGVGQGGVGVLYLAAFGGHTGIVERLVSLGQRIDERTDDGWTGFLVAAVKGNAAIAELLVELGADLNETENSGWTALHLACQSNHVNTIRRLIKLGSNVNATLPAGYTPLHITAYHDCSEAARVLLAEASISPNASVGGLTPLLCAATKGFGDVVSALLEAPGTNPHAENYQGASALKLATEAKSVSAVNALLADPRVDRNHTGGESSQPPLWLAADLEEWDIFALLCDDPQTEIDWTGNDKVTQLHRSAEKNQEFAVKCLLKRGADANAVSKNKDTPLIKAIHGSHEAIVDILLKSGAQPNRSPDTSQTTPLRAAVDSGSASSIKLLAAAGAQLEALDEIGASLMHRAGALTSVNVIDALHSLGVDVNARDQRQRTPLHVAAAHGSPSIVRYLVDHGANPTCRDIDGMTLLHSAIRMGNIETALDLIERDYDQNLNLASLDGWTALHFAAQRHLLDIVNTLIDKGAQLDLFSVNPPLTPLQAAADSGAINVCQRLLEAGADPNSVSIEKASPVVLATMNGYFGVATMLLKTGAVATAVEPSSGASLIEVFKLRRLRRELSGEEVDEQETELEQFLTQNREQTAVVGHPKTVQSTETRREVERPRQVPAYKADDQSATSIDSALRFAPLQNLDYEDPEAPVALPWRIVTGQERAGAIDKVNPVDGVHTLSLQGAQVVWATLPFYESVALVRFRNRDWKHPRLAIYYLTDSSELHRLDGTSLPIYEINAKAPVKLNEQNVVDYVRFFGFFVRGEEGPFHILESADDDALVAAPNQAIQNAISGTVRLASFEGINEKGHFLVDAVIAYSTALFIANYAVHPSGKIEMLSDEPIAGGLHTLVDAPIA